MKKQLKKSLSLFLAVIMLLSCWVWIAPEKAEAGTATQYYVKLVAYIADTGAENWSRVTISFKDTNGTGSIGTMVKDYSGNTWTTKDADATIWEGTVNGWPTGLVVEMNFDGGWKTETHNNYRLYVGSSAETCKTNLIASSPTPNFKYDGGTLGGTVTYTATLKTGLEPKFTEVTDASVTNATINKLPNGEYATAQINATAGKDQYGVGWAAPLPTKDFSYELKYYDTDSDKEVSFGSDYATVSSSTNSATAYFSDNVQKLFPDQGSAKVYAYCKYGDSSVQKQIELTFPTYTITFDANGGKIGEEDNEAKDKIEITSDKMFYGSTIGASPQYRTRDGFTFMGYYTADENGNPPADAVGKTASFSGTKYVDIGDDATKVTEQGDITYYAAWHANPVDVTFVTQDGQHIATLEGRYNNSMVAMNMYDGVTNLNTAIKNAYVERNGKGIEFNTQNQPVYKDGSTSYTFSRWKIIKSDDESLIGGDQSTVLKGNVIFQAVYIPASSETYKVEFYKENGTLFYNQSGKFGDDIKLPVALPRKDQDEAYKYEFIGWAPRLVDEAGNQTGPNFYAVDEYDKDVNGAVISYTHKDAAEFTVRGNASYVPVFRMIPREYKVTFSYTADNEVPEILTVEGYHLGDSITLPEEIKDNYTNAGYRYYINGWLVGSNAELKQLEDISVNGNMYLTATYGDGIPAEYTINFFDKDGNLINGDTNIYTHNATVTAPTVGNTTVDDATAYDIPYTIDTEDSLYTFVGFKDKNGNIYSTTATADADYYAEYTKRDYADIYFYNYDGTLLYKVDGKEAKNFIDDVIPEYNNEVENEDGTVTNVLPEKEADPVGTYEFTGWTDSSGNTVKPGTSKFTGDTYLYAQFKTVYKEYTVKFVNDVLDENGNQVVVSEVKYHYGEDITVPADPSKADDETYEYDFKAWSPDISEVCYGDATYTATYRRAYIPYTVTWYKDDKATKHSEVNYIYGAKIQPAVINEPVAYPNAQTGYEWVLKEWVMCNENGQPITADGIVIAEEAAARFERGMKMGAEHLYFYPVFEEVADIVTVMFYKEDGTSYIDSAKISYGSELSEYTSAFEDRALKTPDDDYHYSIKKWVALDGSDVTTVTNDISVKPVYEAVAHDRVIYEIIKAPTCIDTGLANMKCEAAECDTIVPNAIVDIIPDEAKPTGQIYVGADKWTLEEYKTGIDYNDDVKYVAPNTNVIVNAYDIGSHIWSLENGYEEVDSGAAKRGVGKIDYYVSKEVTTDPTLIQTWNNVYDYNAVAQSVLDAVLTAKGITGLEYIGYATDPSKREKKALIDGEVNAILATYKANATNVLSNLNLVNGEDYIIYIRVSDREVEGKSNKCYFSSGKINYGATAATISVTGDGYGTKFCAEATVKVTDDTDGFRTYIDGEEVTLTNGELTYNKEGVHTVTVIDKHGNKSTKTFEIKGGHTYRNYTVGATCVNAGSRYDQCTLCGEKANIEELAALGHSYEDNYTEKAATCVDNGYRTYVCDNNCGEKLVVTPASAADVLAAAKITAEELAHLKATGKHTYAKVQDENGKDTSEDAWVIDKAATCQAEGSKHKDCTICGAIGRVEENIPADTVNGHKYYREKITTEPTCTEKGQKTQTCRYCGDAKVTGEVDALGHTEGEYKILVEADCELKGSKILCCGRTGCNAEIGKSVEIPALGHAWVVNGKPVKDETDGKYYQNYVCANNSNHTRKEETEYEELVAATVTFDYNGGVVVIPATGTEGEEGYVPAETKTSVTIDSYVGNSISAAQIGEEPVMAETDTYKYTFSHWATRSGEGTEASPYVYTKVDLPVKVEAVAATYYAVYTEKYVNYTITYYDEDQVTEYKKTGYLHNGETYKLLESGPAKAEDWQYEYTFAGWGVKLDKVDENGNKILDANGDPVKEEEPTLLEEQEVDIDGANVVVYAMYTKKTKKYGVTFAYKSNDTIASFKVDAGTNVNEHANKPADPAKEKDSKYHYTFAGWNRDAQLTSVKSNIYTTPNFTSAEHTFQKTTLSDATCTEATKVKFTCTVCGYSYEDTEGSATAHNFGEWKTDDKTGESSRTCQNENCGYKETKTETYTVTFLKPDGNAYSKKYDVKWGTLLSTLVPEKAPEKAKDDEKVYTFSYWKIEDSEIDADARVTANLTVVPHYADADRLYTVTFRYDGGATIKTFKEVKFGDIKATLYNTENDGTPEKACEELENGSHYNFSGWDLKVIDKENDMYGYNAVFTAEKHNFAETGKKVEATCQDAPGKELKCGVCGYTYIKTTGKTSDHDYQLTTNKAPTPEADGIKIYTCSVCQDSYEEIIKYVDPEANYVTITVKVTDRNNNNAPIQGAKVELFEKSGNTVGNRVDAKLTKSDGTVSFYVPKGTYYVTVSGVSNAGNASFDLTANGNITVTDEAQLSIKQCGCACHNTGVWGTIFRFFHKIIQMITGEYKCCKDPSNY